MISYYSVKRKQLKWWKKLLFHRFVMAVVNAYILYHETRNENQRIVIELSSCRRLERDLLRKVQHLPKMMFHKQHQATDSWEGTLVIEYSLLARRHILRECVTFVQKNLRILLEKEKEKRLVVVSWLWSAILHARVLQIVPHKAKHFVNIGNVFLCSFFPVNFQCFSNDLLYASTGIMCSHLYSN